MAQVEPIIGHLLSKYKETVLEGLSKIRHAVQAGDADGQVLAIAVSQQEEALQALRATLHRPELLAPTLQTLTVVLAQLTERGNRVALVRELLRGEGATLFRKILGALSDVTIAHVTAALHFLALAVKDAPLLVLARLRSPVDAHASPIGLSVTSSSALNPTVFGAAATKQHRADVPLHLAAFRFQLTYAQRRIRLARLGFLVQLVISPMHSAVPETICSHGFLTHLLEDAAELLREGTSAGVECAMSALQVVRELFALSRHITAEQKRRVLLAQRNIFRLLVRALELDHVAEQAAAILYAIVDETRESPADYASTRVEALENQGMPNYLLFFLLRQLRPKANIRMAQLVLYILQRAPDLLRPYFIRISGHLAEEGNAPGVAPATARVAVLNVMTRAFLSPMPYHLASLQVRLEPVTAKTSTFYTLCPRDVVDEICPMWVAEYVHRIINGSTNLLMLTLAMQLTHAALARAKQVLPLILAAQKAAGVKKSSAVDGASAAMATSPSRCFSAVDLSVLYGDADIETETWDAFNVQVRQDLQAALPSREEFWHRMTQQLHKALQPATSTCIDSLPTLSGSQDVAIAKTQMVVQRMLYLMKEYVEVLDVRVPWLTAVPVFLPDLRQYPTGGQEGASDRKKMKVSGRRPTVAAAAVTTSPGGLEHPVTAALRQQNDILKFWPPESVALLCELLVASQQRGVPMAKLHHINMSQAQGLGEWPLLLSILLWTTHLAPRLGDTSSVADVRAAEWTAQLLRWTVHGVTIHCTCTVAEAYLWLTCLTPNTVPLMLHVLNHLLMRSLSKAADRVTQELRDTPHGVLVAAALHFIERTKEKQQRPPKANSAADDVVEAQAGARATAVSRGQTRQRASPTYKKPCTSTGDNSQADSGAANLWGTHLENAISEFEEVVANVTRRWGARERLLVEAEAAAEARSQSSALQVTRQHFIDVLVLSDQLRELGASLLCCGSSSAAAQLQMFATTLRNPVPSLSEEEAEGALLHELVNAAALLSAQHADKLRGIEKDGTGDERVAANGAFSARICSILGITSEATEESHGSSSNAPRWYAMRAVCWQVAGILLTISNRSHSSTKTAQKVSLCLLRTLLVDDVAVKAHLVDGVDREGALTGLLLLILTCLYVGLSVSTAIAETEQLSMAERHALGRLCISVYKGSLSVQDRLLYAIFLTLHYQGVGARIATPNKEGANATQANPFVGVEVPDAIVQQRFLLYGHTESANRTPEVEMLAWHLDSLTDDDAMRMAQQASSRLHNELRPFSGDGNARSAAGILFAVFPELTSSEDVGVANLERVVLPDVLDLRYLVPLFHRVAALPPAFQLHLATGRVVPLLLKALTCVDMTLRATAAATLSTLYIPKGALRIVVSVARIKLAQLHMTSSTASNEMRRQPHGQCRGVPPASSVPRLPTPLAIALILSIRPLSRYDDALHHHVAHFLLHLESALETRLPFARWLTAPPLTAVSVPLMLERQEALRRRGNSKTGDGKDGGSGVTQASVADVALELQKSIPPHLGFLLRLLSHACETPEDGAALLESSTLDSLLLLCDLLTASDRQRATLLQCVLKFCTQSASLTQLFAHAGHVLPWIVSFLWELCREYGTATPHAYSSQTFTTALELLRVLCIATVAALPASGPGRLDDVAVEQLRETMQQLRAWVGEAHVTARDVLDTLEEILSLCHRTAQMTPCSNGESDVHEAFFTSVETAAASPKVVPFQQVKRHRSGHEDTEGATSNKRIRPENTA